MLRKLKLYDAKCYDLAELFLSDEPALATHAHADALASLLQTTIEDYIAFEREVSLAKEER